MLPVTFFGHEYIVLKNEHITERELLAHHMISVSGSHQVIYHESRCHDSDALWLLAKLSRGSPSNS